MKTINVPQWRDEHGLDARLEWVFVSYTSSQFKSDADMYYLHQVGQHAARAAGVNAYWLACSCLGSIAEQEHNVWRICDVVRGAFSLVIVLLGDQVDSMAATGEPYELLGQWLSRVWILPELLLSPEKE